jgi:hypothetical protein
MVPGLHLWLKSVRLSAHCLDDRYIAFGSQELLLGSNSLALSCSDFNQLTYDEAYLITYSKQEWWNLGAPTGVSGPELIGQPPFNSQTTSEIARLWVVAQPPEPLAARLRTSRLSPQGRRLWPLAHQP